MTKKDKDDKTAEKNMGEKIIDTAQNVNTANDINQDVVNNEQDAKISELTADLQRTRADFENFRRQVDSQRESYANAARFATVKKVLPLLDDIDRAIAANPDTLGPLAKNLEKTLREIGLTKIITKPGDAFSTDLHDAVLVEGDGDNEVIAEELRAGYTYDGEVIRPAMVKVSKE
jgi:molecular chaperone GrpE